MPQPVLVVIDVQERRCEQDPRISVARCPSYGAFSTTPRPCERLYIALDLLGVGFRISVVADAVCSRPAANLEIGLAQARPAGAVTTATETVVFQLVGRAGTDSFRDIRAQLT